VIRLMIVCSLLFAACAVDPDLDPEQIGEHSDAIAAVAPRDRLVVPGAGLQILDVTDDNYAIYQAGQQVFAAALDAGRAPELIGDVPAGNTAFVFQVGRVAFVWTNPDRTLPGFGVSPLVIWSARTGARLASPASAIGTLATSANHDADRVLFTSNSDPSGATGDLVLASTDLSEQTTVAAGIPMGFPSGPCVPRATFHGPGDDLAAVFCAAGSATATLAQWRHGTRRDLAQPVFAPPRLVVDPAGRAVTLLAGSQFPISVDRRGNVTVLAETAATSVQLGGDGAHLFTTAPAPSGLRSLFRTRTPQSPRLIADFLGLHTFLFGSLALTQPITSADGRHVLYFDALDSSSGLSADVILGDARGIQPPVTLDTGAVNGLFAVPFTRDSRFALYARFDITNFAVGPMFAHGADGTRQYSDDNGWQWGAAFGSTITYNDNTILDNANVALSIADIKVVDLARRNLTPRLIVRGANVTYFGSHGGTGVVYALDTGPAPGLHVARVF